MPKWLRADGREVIVVGALTAIWLSFLSVGAAAQAHWSSALVSLVIAVVIVVMTALLPRVESSLRSREPAPRVRRWLGPASGLLSVLTAVLVLVAVSWTIGGMRALARGDWGLALRFLVPAVTVFAWQGIILARKKGRASGRSVSAATTEEERREGRVVVLQFGKSRLKVARTIHRLRADARLPVALIDYQALPFVAGEGLPQDVATRWVDELSAVGALASVQ